MNEAGAFALVFITNCLAFALVALAMPKHLTQVLNKAVLTQGRIKMLRATGFCLLGIDLVLALTTQGLNFGSVMWVLALALGAATVALTLTWRPQWLRPLARVIRG